MTDPTAHTPTLSEHIARAIWQKRPDCAGKPWPFDDMTEKQRRAYQHNPIAAVDLCFIYADAAIAAHESAPGLDAPHNSGERLPQVTRQSPELTPGPTLSERLLARVRWYRGIGDGPLMQEARETIDRLTAALAEAEAANRLGADCLMTAQERCEEAERKWASWKSECVNTQAQLTAASSRIGELEAGLKPFADMADYIEGDKVVDLGAIDICDLRRARALLTGGGSNG